MNIPFLNIPNDLNLPVFKFINLSEDLALLLFSTKQSEAAALKSVVEVLEIC